VTLAQSGKTTILVDCDLRRPSQQIIWGIDQEPGLTSMILEGVKEPPLCEVVENLYVLPSGPLPPNPADFLSSPRLDGIIEMLTKRADLVLFDAPPVIAVTDAALLAVKLDALLLVMRAGATRRDHAERAKELLQRIGVRILGVALTNAQTDAQMSGYY
jgi:non-specific protein-tyrosine kinase